MQIQHRREVELPASVRVSVRSPHQGHPAAPGGVTSRRSPSGALRVDLSGVVIPRRRRLRRAMIRRGRTAVQTVPRLFAHWAWVRGSWWSG
jgi:hypothetical protein